MKKIKHLLKNSREMWRAPSARPRGMRDANLLRIPKGGACPPLLKRYKINFFHRDAFTFVEVVLVTGIGLILLGIVSILLTQFRQSYSKGEKSTVVLQEGSLFLAMLRNDFINTVMRKETPVENWREVIEVTKDRIVFPMFRDAEGAIDQVEYSLLTPSNPREGYSIQRSQGGGRARTLLNKNIASITWKIGTDVIPGIATGVRQIWLDLRMVLGGQGESGVQSKLLPVNTKLFPTRLNRQINSQ